jgi:periplasmic mercuric ion binding protein
MKNLKLKISAITVFSVILISAVILSGCTKQDKKETTDNKLQKTETTQQQNNMQHDSSMKMNHDNMDMSKDNKTDMNKDSKGNLEHKMIKIPSAQCDICKGKISKALKKVNGVKTFEVDIDNKIVHVNFDNSLTDLSKIEKAITLAGYDANNKKADPEAYAKLDDCCKKPEDRKNKK